MKRRAVLASLAVSTATVAGCLSEARLERTGNSCAGTEQLSFEADTDEFIVVTDDNTVDSLVFTLQNQTSCSLMLDPKAWHIERKSGDGWEQIASGDHGDEQITIANGSEHGWSLSLTPHPTPHTDSTTFVVADLSEATYAFVLAGTVDSEERITRRAEFTLEKQTQSETN